MDEKGKVAEKDEEEEDKKDEEEATNEAKVVTKTQGEVLRLAST